MARRRLYSEISFSSMDSSLEARGVEPLSFHSLRRTATTILHEAGVPAAVAQALIGHDSEAIHEPYVSVGRVAWGKGPRHAPEAKGQ
jgi:integrase